MSAERAEAPAVGQAGAAVAAVVVTMAVLAGVGLVILLVGSAGAAGLPLLLLLLFGSGWVVYTFVRYRAARRRELIDVLATAVELDQPLGPALRAHLRDRPHGGAYAFLVALVQHVFVSPGYYWLWHRTRSFDDRTGRLADRLDEGQPLSEALRELPALASREARVAAAVGESSGRLAECLRRADREPFAASWLELLPRLVYPVLLLMFIFGVTAFLMAIVIPKLKRIFFDFGRAMPEASLRLIAGWEWVIDHAGAMGLALTVGVFLAALVVASPGVRWWTPVVGRFYRWDVQGLVLRSLGMLLSTGQPVPSSLGLLAESEDVPAPAERRLRKARALTERGEPLAAALGSAGLLPAAMRPLVQAAERAGTLPWALGEIGEVLARKGIGLARRLSVLIAPAALLAVGALVLLVVLGVFIPLIDLMGVAGE